MLPVSVLPGEITVYYMIGQVCKKEKPYKNEYSNKDIGYHNLKFSGSFVGHQQITKKNKGNDPCQYIPGSAVHLRYFTVCSGERNSSQNEESCPHDTFAITLQRCPCRHKDCIKISPDGIKKI